MTEWHSDSRVSGLIKYFCIEKEKSEMCFPAWPDRVPQTHRQNRNLGSNTRFITCIWFVFRKDD